jgi:hypothetical protein
VTTDWTTGVRSPAEAKDFSSGLCVQTSSENHSASYPRDMGESFSRGKARPGCDADHSPHLVWRSIMSRSYTSLFDACMAVAALESVQIRPCVRDTVETSEIFA